MKQRNPEESHMTSKEFVTQLKKEIQAFPKIRIKHPFLKAVCNGTATMDQIREWTIQDYQFRATVPRIAMLRYLACTDPEIAQKLWGVVEEETRGMETGSAGHNELAIRFAESIGLKKEQLENAILSPSTAKGWRSRVVPSSARWIRRIGSRAHCDRPTPFPFRGFLLQRHPRVSARFRDRYTRDSVAWRCAEPWLGTGSPESSIRGSGPLLRFRCRPPSET